MTWNYRIIEFADHYALHEVYYDKSGKVKSWTDEPVSFACEKGPYWLADMERSITMALEDVRRRKPLKESDLPKGNE